MQRNTHFFRLFIIGLLLVFKANVSAQTYSVQTSLATSPPYFNYLSHYADQNNHLQVVLTLLDFNNPPINVRLRVRIEGPGYELYTNPNVVVGQPLQLQSGIPLFLTDLDLQPYLQESNLIVSPSGLDINNLPEGFTTICVDVILDGTNQEVISSDNCTSFVLQHYSPAQPFLPMCESVLDTNQLFHTFQWSEPIGYTPDVNTTIEHTFSLYRWNDPNNFTIFQSDQGLVWRETVNFPMVQISDFDIAFENGGLYVWRVQSQIYSNGMPVHMIENDGVSMPCTFYYGEPQSLADMLTDGLYIDLNTDPLSTRKGKAYWTVIDNTPNEGLSTFDKYLVEYRRQPTGNESYQIPWFADTVTNFNLFIYQLEPSTTYEVKVSGIVGTNIGDPTPVETFTTPDPRVYACGEGDLPFFPTNWSALQNAQAGIQVQIGQFLMNTTQLQSVGMIGHYSGKGTISIPFLMGAKAQVTFDDILIDTEYLVREGRVDVVTQGLENWLHEQYGQFVDPIYVNGVIDSAYVDSNGVAWAVVDGISIPYTFDPPTYPIVLNDANGNQYTIYPNGDIEISTYIAISEEWNVEPDEVAMFSQNDYENRGFDPKEHMQWHENYEIMRLADSSLYFVANKSMAEGESDVVNVELPQGTQASFQLADGTPITSSSLQGNWLGQSKYPSGVKYTLSIPMLQNAGNYQVHCFANNQKVGQLNVVVYSEKQKDVIVVPMVDNLSITESDIKQKLDETLGEANINVTVTLAPQWNNSTFTPTTTISLPTETGLLNKYSDEQRALRDAYFDANPNATRDAYYLFMVHSFDDPNELGYMVRGRAMGFIQAAQADVLNTIAHELGHGIGALEHSWKHNGPQRDSTSNLMDYGTVAGNLIREQWRELRDLDFMPSMFDEIEDASYSLSVVDYICIPANVVFTTTDVFRDLDNRIIKLDSGFSPYAFVGSLTDNIQGRLAMVIDSTGTAYWPSSGSGSTGYYQLKPDGSVNPATQYIPSIGTGSVAELTTDNIDYNKFIFKRDNNVVLSQINPSIRCIHFDGGGSGTGIQIPLSGDVFIDTTGSYPISSGLQSPITNDSYDGILDLHGYPVKLSSLSNIRIRKSLVSFEMNGDAYIPLFSTYGNSRLFAGYIEQNLYDSLITANNALTYGDVQSSLLLHSSFEEPSTGGRIFYRLYEARLGDCYEEFSFVHNGRASYVWQNAGSRYQNEIERRTEWRGCGLALLSQLYCESVSSGLEGFGTIVSGLLDFIEINEKYYDPTLSDYDPSYFDLFNEINPNKWIYDDQQTQVQFAYLCGIVNGALGEVDGLAQSLGMIADYFCDQNFRQDVHTALSNLSFDDIKNKVSSDFQGNIYQKAHKTGVYTVMALTIIVPITKVNWAAKAATFSAQITSFSAKTLKFLDKIKSGTLNGLRTARDGISNLKKILFKKSTGAEITLINFTDEGIYVIEPTVFGQVDNTYTLVYEIGEVTYRIGNNGSEEVGLLSVYKKGDNVVITTGALDPLTRLTSILNKTGFNGTGGIFDQLKALSPSTRRTADYASIETFRDKFLYLHNANNNGVKSIEEVLDDFDNLISNHSNVPDVDKYVDELMQSTNKFKGGAFGIEILNDLPPALQGKTLSRFEAGIDDLEAAATNCRFDLQFSDGTNFTYIETKNYAQSTAFTSSFYNQFKAYISNSGVTSIDQIKYYFRSNSGVSEVERIQKFKNMLLNGNRTQQVFSGMSEALRIDLLGISNKDNFMIFMQKINDPTSNFYQFIEIF